MGSMMPTPADLCSTLERHLESADMDGALKIISGIDIADAIDRAGPLQGWLAYMSAAYVMGVIATPVAGLIWVFWRTRSWLLVVQTGSNLPTILPDVLLTSLLATPIGLLFWLIVRPDRRG